jgi:hypothetical protein
MMAGRRAVSSKLLIRRAGARARGEGAACLLTWDGGANDFAYLDPA